MDLTLLLPKRRDQNSRTFALRFKPIFASPPPRRLFQQKVFISFPRLQMWTAAYTYTEGREHLPKGEGSL